jgi:hypothetical protein
MHRALQGTGSYAGSWIRDEKYTIKFTVVKHDANMITISDQYSGSWSSTATDTWVKANGGQSSQGIMPPVELDYTIDLTSMNITAVEQESMNLNQKLYPRPFTWLLINPQNLGEGGTVWIWKWRGPETAFGVGGSQTVDVKGAKVDAWSLSYTGSWPRPSHVGNSHSTGSESITYLYDKTYGVLLGWNVTGTSNYTVDGGGYRIIRSDNFQASDSNIFTQPNAFSVLTQPYVLAGILAAILVAAVALLRMRRHHPHSRLFVKFSLEQQPFDTRQ